MQSRPEKRNIIFKMPCSKAFIFICAVSLGVTVSVGYARAESLKEALAAAYLFNPTLKAARAQLRATDEEVPRAKSGYRPTIEGQATQSYEDVNTNLAGQDNSSEPRSYSVTLNQPVFRGFQTYNAVKGAQAQVEAGRENLRFEEQGVLVDAVTSYVDVVRDQAILRLRQNNLKVLSEQEKATKDRFDVGEVTKTDVSQARARASGASSAISAAKAQLQTSRAAFAQIIGRPPRRLRNPGVARALPKSLQEALAISEGENPQLLAAIFNERAQNHLIKQTKGELLPSVDLQASYTREDNIGANTGLDRQEVGVVQGVLTVPIYQAGDVSARIRQNIETRSQLRHLIDEAREAVRAQVVSAWGQYTAASAQIISDRAQVNANKVALAGVREEEKVGQRTVLDVLDAEQELLDSQVALATTRRDLVVFSYQVLQAIGRLSVVSIGLPVEQYDPTQHYRNVKNQWIGWDTKIEQNEWEPVVSPVVAEGRTPDQPRGDGPAYTVHKDDWFR